MSLSNRFESLSEDIEVGAVQIDMNLKEAGRSRITIDSGAAESALPRNILPNEPIVEGEAKRRRTSRPTAGRWRTSAKRRKVQESGLESSEFHHLPGHVREQAVDFGIFFVGD